MYEPLVSIIMPVYNAEKYLAEAIQSVINQTYKNWELLIVNDGSTDNSSSLLLKFNSDSRIRIFNQANKGVSAARNMALVNMKGDYFCFLDSDDTLPLKSIEERVRIFQKDFNITFVDGYVMVYDEHNRIIKNIWKPSFIGHSLSKLLQLSSSCFFGPTWMIRFDKKYKYHFEPTLKHAEDLLFYISIADQGIYTFLDKPTYCYRDRPGSAMKDIRGLGSGYLNLRDRLKEMNKFNLYNRSVFEFRIKKIMFLTFLRGGSIRDAIAYLFK